MPHDGDALWEFLSGQGHLAERALSAPDAHVPLSDLAHGSSLGAPLEEFSDRSVLVATRGQLVAALALIELSGVARRVVLCPPDVSAEHVAIVIATAAVDTVVSDQRRDVAARPHVRTVLAGLPQRVSTGLSRRTRRRTEWILLTSGTTGAPKLVLHTLASLTGPIARDTAPVTTTVWSTFYDIRRYGGLQIFLRSVLGGGSLVLSDSGESTDAFLGRVAALGVTHISGTPSHWRRALMSTAARKIAPRYVRLSGEIADQAILDRLRALYPDATIAHAFASTEAGVAFAVSDGRAGFPAGLIGDARGAVEKRIGDVEMRIEDGSLRDSLSRRRRREPPGRGRLRGHGRHGRARRRPLPLRGPSRRRHQRRRSESPSGRGRGRAQRPFRGPHVDRAAEEESDHRRPRRGRGRADARRSRRPRSRQARGGAPRALSPAAAPAQSSGLSRPGALPRHRGDGKDCAVVLCVT